MRRLRDWRLLATALGFLIGTASPALVVAHALAHDRGAHEAHRHIGALEAHDGPAELSTREHTDSHRHVWLDRAAPTPTHQLLLGPPVTTTGADLDTASSKRVAVIPAPSVPAPDPPGDDPPRLRAPPSH